MPVVISKCGMNCGVCPWGPYARENMTKEEYEQFKMRAKGVLGYTPMEKPCPTCRTPDAEIPKGSRLPSRKCVVRRCVDRLGVENCAYCSRFPCIYEKEHASTWNRAYFEKKLGKPISEEDYLAFIEPFEGVKHLEAVRAEIKPEEIKDAVKMEPLKPKLTGFPGKLVVSPEKVEALKKLHKILVDINLSSLGVEDIDIFPQQQRQKSRIRHFLRFLWIFARFGELKKGDGAHLVVDAETYIDNRGSEKGLATWPYVEGVLFKVLPEFGIHGELAPKAKRWKTPGGGLRKKGWSMKISLEETVGGAATLKTLQDYAEKLEEKYGKKAFQHFVKADMQVFSKDLT